MKNLIYKKADDITKNKIYNRHTFFQLKHFVLGKELTTQSKLQKCLREIDARKRTIKSIFFGIEDAKDDLELMNLKELNFEKKKPKNNIDNKNLEIQIRKLKRKKEMLLDSIKEMEIKLKEAEEETDFFIKAFEQLEMIEPLKRYDDPDSNAEFWNENFMQDLKLRLMLQKPIDIELIKCILSLDSESPVRKEVVGILDQVQRKAITQKC